MSSDVARTRQRIEDEARSAWAALYGLRQGGAEHRVIEARMSGFIEELSEKIGDDEACRMIMSFDAEKQGEPS